MSFILDHNDSNQYNALRDALDYTIQESFSARLGYRDDNGITHLKVDSEDTDLPNQYYFHNPLKGTQFVGMAFNTGQVPIPDKFLIYDMPVKVKQTGKSIFELAGLDGILAAEFIADVPLMPPDNPTRLENFLPGLLDQTDPASMKYRIMGAAYRHNQETRYETTITASADITSKTDFLDNAISLPSVGFARYILVQWDYESHTEVLKQGDLFSQSLTHISARTLDINDSGVTIFPFPDSDKFKCGYIRLQNDTTALLRTTNIWTQQELYSLADGTNPRNIPDGVRYIIQSGRQAVWYGNIIVEDGGLLKVEGQLRILNNNFGVEAHSHGSGWYEHSDTIAGDETVSVNINRLLVGPVTLSGAWTVDGVLKVV
jgi:hypothetical protein